MWEVMPRHNLPHAGGCLKSVPGGGTDFKLLPEHPHALEVDRCIWGTQMLHLGYPNVLVRLSPINERLCQSCVCVVLVELLCSRRVNQQTEEHRMGLSGSWHKGHSRTYNSWVQQSRLQKIYHFQGSKLRVTPLAFSGVERSSEPGPKPMLLHVALEAMNNTEQQHGSWLRGVQP